jgi:hypothetical protein
MLVSRQFDDEVILANFDTGIYYSLTDTAADIWLGLKSGATVDDIAAAFAKLGGGGAEDYKKPVAGFIETLLAENMILPLEGTADPQPWSPQFSNSFSQPVLGRFEDLRDLLFLDPVHDVSEAGWPMRAKDGD